MKVESFTRFSQHLSNLDLLEIWEFSLKRCLRHSITKSIMHALDNPTLMLRPILSLDLVVVVVVETETTETMVIQTMAQDKTTLDLIVMTVLHVMSMVSAVYFMNYYASYIQ